MKIMSILVAAFSLSAFTQTSDNLLFLGDWSTSFCSVDYKQSNMSDFPLIKQFTNSSSLNISKTKNAFVFDSDIDGKAFIYSAGFQTSNLKVEIKKSLFSSSTLFWSRGFHYSYVVQSFDFDYKFEAFLNLRSSNDSAQFFVHIKERDFFGFYRKVATVDCPYLKR